MTFTDGDYGVYESIILPLIEKGVFPNRKVALEAIVYSFFRLWDELGMDADKVSQLDPTGGQITLPLEDPDRIRAMIYAVQVTSLLETWWDDNHPTPKYDNAISTATVVRGSKTAVPADLDGRLQGLVDDEIFADIDTEVKAILICATRFIQAVGLTKAGIIDELGDGFPITDLDGVEYYISSLMDSTLVETSYDASIVKMGYPAKYSATDGVKTASASKTPNVLKKVKFP